MRRYAWMLAGVLLGTACGCDDKGGTDPSSPEAVRAREISQLKLPPKPVLPTTRELLEGEKKTQKLGDFPLTLQVPRNWQLSSWGDASVATVHTVGGPASSGDVSIQLVQQGQPIAAERVGQIFEQGKKDIAAKPHPVNRVELRSLGSVQVLEQRLISNEYVNGKLPAEQWGDVRIEGLPGQPSLTTRAVVNPHLVKWSLTVFLPAAEKKMLPRTLQFMGLKLSEYEQDKEFLERLVKSLKYEE